MRYIPNKNKFRIYPKTLHSHRCFWIVHSVHDMSRTYVEVSTHPTEIVERTLCWCRRFVLLMRRKKQSYCWFWIFAVFYSPRAYSRYLDTYTFCRMCSICTWHISFLHPSRMSGWVTFTFCTYLVCLCVCAVRAVICISFCWPSAELWLCLGI